MHRDAHIMQLLPARGVQSDLLGSDLEWGSWGTGCCFLSWELLRGSRQPDCPMASERWTGLGTESWSGSLVSEGTRAGVLVSPPAARKEKPLSKSFGFTR